MDNNYYTVVETMAIKYLQKIGRKYPYCGYGEMFSQWIFSNNPKPYNSFGNGAAMRISPAGLVAKTENEAKKLSKSISVVTHNHDEGIKGARSVAVTI
ncbi:MAG: ADP-ribosylglycohydrolase family protein [Bacillota bacterium]